MPGNFKNDDLRIIKTQKALMESLVLLLRRRSFNKITVNDLCGEAQISRVAFYSHFQDKYDLLSRWLKSLKTSVAGLDAFVKTKGWQRLPDAFDQKQFDEAQKSINEFVKDNSQAIANVVSDASAEVSAIVCDFIFSLFDIPEERDEKGKLTERYVVLRNFCSGGLLNLLNWHVGNAFPEYLKLTNKYLFNLLCMLLKNE